MSLELAMFIMEGEGDGLLLGKDAVKRLGIAQTLA